MEPEVFLEQRDVVPLTKALIKVLMNINTASDRHSLLVSTDDRNTAWIGNLRLDSAPNILAPGLVAAFKTYRVSSRQPHFHPMVKVLSYLGDFAENYGLSDEEVALFTRLINLGQENFKALKVRSAVGRIESPQGTGIGTGVLVGKNLLLTCNHVLSKTLQQAWVRFGYKTGSTGDVFELDDNVSSNSNPDYALIRIQGQPQQPILSPIDASLDAGQEIWLIHHPLGKPVVITSGKVMQVGKDYIDHNIGAQEGSSGAPIFNRQWELVAIHQGHPGIGRNVVQGTLGGIPIRAFWEQIKAHLS